MEKINYCENKKYRRPDNNSQEVLNGITTDTVNPSSRYCLSNGMK